VGGYAGQSAVLYREEASLGGGVIEELRWLSCLERIPRARHPMSARRSSSRSRFCCTGSGWSRAGSDDDAAVAAPTSSPSPSPSASPAPSPTSSPAHRMAVANARVPTAAATTTPPPSARRSFRNQRPVAAAQFQVVSRKAHPVRDRLLGAVGMASCRRACCHAEGQLRLVSADGAPCPARSAECRRLMTQARAVARRCP